MFLRCFFLTGVFIFVSFTLLWCITQDGFWTSDSTSRLTRFETPSWFSVWRTVWSLFKPTNFLADVVASTSATTGPSRWCCWCCTLAGFAISQFAFSQLGGSRSWHFTLPSRLIFRHNLKWPRLGSTFGSLGSVPEFGGWIFFPR